MEDIHVTLERFLIIIVLFPEEEIKIILSNGAEGKKRWILTSLNVFKTRKKVLSLDQL